MTTAVLPATSAEAQPRAHKLRWTLVLGVLGVVYGDIGTSPLYAFKASLDHFTGGHWGSPEVLGILSLIFWSLFLVVTVKYVSLVMRADNRGEGGILALMAMAQHTAERPRLRAALIFVGILGACLFFGDGVITPAISVLSAVEGLEVSAPELTRFVLPACAVIIVALFALQSRGTAGIGKLFGPVMVAWFVVIGLLGIVQIAREPSVLWALSPWPGLWLIGHHRLLAFVALGSVVLCVTGAEALYADMGHFGPRPIRVAWTFFVLPSLVLNYFGQGALVLLDPRGQDNPFFLAAPAITRLPLVILATAATVIASQAVISGAYSMARQCMQLGFLPRMRVTHTSRMEEGQIYVPQINIALMVGVLVLVFAFGSSDALASAYGIAVTGTFVCTCILAAVVFRSRFGWSRRLALGVWGAFAAMDAVFFAANCLKLPEGGWVPLILGLFLLGLMTSWKRGRDLLLARWRADSLMLSSFLSRLPNSRIVRVPGTAVFLTGTPEYVPAALLHNLKHNKVLHERVLFVTVQNLDVPDVGHETRMAVTELAPNIHRVLVRYGFMEIPNLPRDLIGLRNQGVAFDPMQASYFLGRETLVQAAVPRMPRWRVFLFLLMARNATSAVEFFQIPSDRVVELGVRITI